MIIELHLINKTIKDQVKAGNNIFTSIFGIY